ncbi:ABC transporter ATP-binding protein, partial [Levilactobacillus brevis]|uniref:ABC transporter ATP-binding protein n=1 Tax=Levilactobacillus brevis TaxID=1580 RepID=UPI003D78924D
AYGGIQAVKGVDLEIREGELVTLIGANGAGKTTTMKAITGLQGWAGGDVQYLGKSIKGVPSYNLLKQGLAMVPEGRGVFARMTIVENLQMGAFTRNDEANIKADIDRMFGIFPRLKERANQLAGTMSGGEQQMLAVGRILRTGANLLLLDEISEGLAPVIVQALARMILMLKKRGYTVVMVEQNFRFAAPL